VLMYHPGFWHARSIAIAVSVVFILSISRLSAHSEDSGRAMDEIV
jgi:hypothetical protein